MKIAVLTLPLHTNYGGILQAYAVQQILKDMGHDVITLDILHKTHNKTIFEQLRLFIATIVCCLLGRIQYKQIYWPFNTRQRNIESIVFQMRKSIKNIIKLSPLLKNSAEIKKYIKEQNIDICIVGSDQVWRASFCPNIDCFFLNFLEDDDNIKRIALSASFGTDRWEFSEEQTERIISYAKKFNAISVRELTGVSLCRDYLGVGSIRLIDPTMVVSLQKYSELVEKEKCNTTSIKGSIFSYILDDTKEKLYIIKDVSKRLNKSVITMRADIKLPPYASYKTAMSLVPKPVEQWLRNFQEADFVVTDSFHGTVFAILYHCPFVVLRNSVRGMSRISTLLKTFNLQDRLVNSLEDKSIEWLLKGVDWSETNNILDKEKYMFLDFLRQNLN